MVSQASNYNTESQVYTFLENKTEEQKHGIAKMKLYHDQQLSMNDSILRFERIFIHVYLNTIVAICL